MKLLDFSRCAEFNKLLVGMGVKEIPHLPMVKFEKEVIEQIEIEIENKEEIELKQKLKDGAIAVSKHNLTFENDIIEYKGRKACVYIRDQKSKVDFYYKISEYKFHLCNCRTLQSMRDIGREDRYLATQRSDGLFEVHDLTSFRVRSGNVKMEICRNCVEILQSKGMYKYPFNLSEYFESYDSFVPKNIKSIEEVRKIQTYSPNQNDISREYRKASDYRCQMCDVNLSEHPNLLHLHHKNGIPSNNNHENLSVLCVDCHSDQPMHQRMKVNPQFKRQITIIKKIRNEQGIFSI